MPSSMSDFLQTFIGIKQVMNQTEQVAQQAHRDAISGMDTFLNTIKHTADPSERLSVANHFAQMGIGSAQELIGMSTHAVPTIEAQKEYQTRLGIASGSGDHSAAATPGGEKLAQETANVALTGHNAGQLGASSFLGDLFKKVDTTGPAGDNMALGLASRTATGGTPADMLIDAATRSLPSTTLEQMAEIKGGTKMTAAQDAGNQLGFANLRENNRQGTLTSGYQMGSLSVEAAKIRATQNGHDPQQIDKLLEQKASILKTIEGAKDARPAFALGMIGALNGVNQQLSGYGIATEGFIDYKPEDLVGGSLWDRIKNKIGPTATGAKGPTNSQPVGAGRR